MGECDYCNHKGELYNSSEYNDWEDNMCESCWQQEHGIYREELWN